MEDKRILIDADACPRPVLAIAERLASEKNWMLITYASFNHQLTGANHVVVDAEPEAVDMRIANEVRANDIVITQDIGLAALILGKRAHALNPFGRIYRMETIAFQLEERNEKARYRRGGGRTRGPAARTQADDAEFAHSLQLLMREQDSPTT
ncbi:YaiI/YqxD family protein [Brevibacillus ginsengisoli]|uniref:YaiI/YqxD family protein n=1 Tax=Brevibacillus ginsengisoli TaxID=363854 RepID=UPI003CF6F6B6